MLMRNLGDTCAISPFTTDFLYNSEHVVWVLIAGKALIA